MKGFVKNIHYLLTTTVLMLALVPNVAFCQEEDIDVNSIRKQLRQAKEQSENADTEDYKKLVEAEKNLLKKLESKGAASAVSIKREIPKVKETKTVEKIIAKEPRKEIKEDFKASISPKAAESVAKSTSAKSNGEFKELEERLKQIKNKYEGKASDYSKIKETNASLKKKLNSSSSSVAKLRRELEEARNRLMVAETEVERLSAVLEERKAVAARQPKPKKLNASASRIGSEVSIDKGPDREKYVNDMPIATVVVKKANIRTGPGVNNSPLMTVSRGTRLAVETRKGDWYRIIAPTGVRAWVNTEVIAFGEDYKASPSRTVKVKGYNGEAEEG